MFICYGMSTNARIIDDRPISHLEYKDERVFWSSTLFGLSLSTLVLVERMQKHMIKSSQDIIAIESIDVKNESPLRKGVDLVHKQMKYEICVSSLQAHSHPHPLQYTCFSQHIE